MARTAIPKIYKIYEKKVIVMNNEIACSKILNSINEINDFLISSDFSLNSVLHLIITKALELSHADYGQILLYDGYNLTIASATDNSSLDQKLTLEECVCGEAIKTGKLINTGDVYASDNYKRFFSDSASELAVPLIQAGRVIGVLNLESRQKNAFTPEIESITESISRQAAYTIKIASLYLQQRTLAQIKENLSSPGSRSEKIYSLIIQGALKLINGRSGQLLIKKGEQLIITATTGNELPMSTVVNVDNSISGLAVKTNKPVNIGNIKAPEYNSLYKPYLGEMKSELAIPISEGDNVIGILNFEHPSENFFTEEHIRILKSMADLSAIAIKNFRITESFETNVSKIKNSLNELEQFRDNLNSSINAIKVMTELFDESIKAETNSYFGVLPPTDMF